MIAITTFASAIAQNFGINQQSANRSKPSKTKVNHISTIMNTSMRYIQTINTNEMASYCCGFYENGSKVFHTHIPVLRHTSSKIHLRTETNPHR